jgi:para-aminobenzoate synthetase
MDGARRRILYIDAYDSFANNIVALLRLSLDIDVEVVTHDEYNDVQSFKQCLRYFDAVVVGPGPGDPRREEDVGIIRYLWSLSEEDILPVLGICLGFQDLCRAFGGEVCSHRLCS